MRMATFNDLPTEIKSLIFKERYDKMKHEKYKKNYDICILELESVYDCYNYPENFVVDGENYGSLPYKYKNPIHYFYLCNQAYLYNIADIGEVLLEKYNEKYKPKLTVLLCTNGKILPVSKITTKYDILAI
jgi:hypothetical protein